MPRNPRDPVNDFVRKRIRLLRLKKNLTTGQVADLSGISEASYCCLENGFSRISIANLQRITLALGADIGDVWPEQMQSLEPAALMSADCSDRDRLRFDEICSLTAARSAALLSTDADSAQILFESNLAREDQDRLLRQVRQGRQATKNWRFYRKSQSGRSVCLALHLPILEGRLGSLAELYVNLWLSTWRAEGITRQETGIRKTRRPKVGGI